MFGWRCNIGLLVPPDNVLVDREFELLSPEGVAVHPTRLHTREMAAGDMEVFSLSDSAVEVAEHFGLVGMDAVVHADNMTTFYHGPGHDEDIAREISDSAGVPATTASTAMIAALHKLDAEDVVVSPYDDEGNDRLRTFLEGNDVNPLEISGLGIDAFEVEGGLEIEEQTAQDTYERVVTTKRDDADAVLINATNLASVQAIDIMEADIGKPVVSVNLASMWHALSLAGVDPSVDGYGTLLS